MFYWVPRDKVGDRVESVNATSLALPYATSLLVHDGCAGIPQDDVDSLVSPWMPGWVSERSSVCVDSVAYGCTAVLWEYRAACANDVLGEHHKDVGGNKALLIRHIQLTSRLVGLVGLLRIQTRIFLLSHIFFLARCDNS